MKLRLRLINKPLKKKYLVTNSGEFSCFHSFFSFNMIMTEVLDMVEHEDLVAYLKLLQRNSRNWKTEMISLPRT